MDFIRGVRIGRFAGHRTVGTRAGDAVPIAVARADDVLAAGVPQWG